MRFPRPGPCPLCGVFVATRRKHAYRCSPPVTEPLLRMSGTSPLLAWPSSHRVQRRDGTYLRSPVAGIGPRLLVTMARHRSHVRRDLPNWRKARYGPSHALQDLVEADSVVEEVLSPGPAWAPCSGTWHRVLPWGDGLWAMDHGEIDLTGERVAAAISGQRLTGCVAALADWEQRATAVRLPWLETLAKLEAAASWGFDAMADHDLAIEARVTSDLAAAALTLGVEEAELLRWVPWLRDPARIAQWRACGWTSKEAERLSLFGLTPDGSRAWREAGLDVALIEDALGREMPPEVAGRWWAAGFRLSAAEVYWQEGLDVEDVSELPGREGRGL